MSKPRMQRPNEPSELNTGSVPVAKVAPAALSGAAPRIVGRYALFDEIAAGGMGAVHLGRQLGSAGFERVVAVKRAHSSMTDDVSFVAMFREEIRLLSRIRHQNVVPALDVVEEDGELLLVMEYVHGQPLNVLARQARDREHAMPVEICVAIACGVLHGLHAVHTARSATGEPLCIVHRDVSPQNVLVGCDGLARILDFGVAKAANSADVTRVGHVKGKLGYVAPEHLLGKPSDSRADLYGLSVVLWEMLAGARLFESSRDTDVVESVLSGKVPRFAAVTSRRVPGALEDIVRRGLATNPAERFSSARDLALALQGAVSAATAQEVGDWVTEVAHGPLVTLSRQLAWAENCPLSGASGERASHAAEAEPSQPEAPDEFDDKTVLDEPVTLTMPPPALPPAPLLKARAPEPEQAATTIPSQRAQRHVQPVRRGFLYLAALAVAVVAANLVTHGALAARLRQYVTPVNAAAHAARPAEGADAEAAAALPAAPVLVASLPLARALSANPTPKPSSKLTPAASSSHAASRAQAAPVHTVAPAATPLPSHATLPVHVRKPAKSTISEDGF